MEAGERRWAAAYAHRERLLRLARARLGNAHDAEDVVQEAILRCVEFDGLDEDRIGQFLTSVTTRLCTDVHRGHARGDRLSRKLTAFWGNDPSPEDSVCDRAESAWLSRRLNDLTPRQREIVEARAEGLSCGAVAERLLVPYTTVESAMARVRRSLRLALESTLGAVPVPLRRLVASASVAAAVTIGAGPGIDLPDHAPAPWNAPAGGDVAARTPGAPAEVPASGTGATSRTATAEGTSTAARAAAAPPAPQDGSQVHRELIVDPPGPGKAGTYVDSTYGFDEEIRHCVYHGWSAGPGGSGCRRPPGQPNNNEGEYVGTPDLAKELP